MRIRLKVLRQDLEPCLVLTFILRALSGLRSEEKGYFDADPRHKQLYVELAIDSLCGILSPEASHNKGAPVKRMQLS